MNDNTAVSGRAAEPLRDRSEAGHILAPLIAKLSLPRPKVLGLPRGGIPVAAPVAHELGAPLDFLVVRKLGLPANPEYAFGAVSEHSEPIIDHRTVAAADLLHDEVERIVARERAEVQRRTGAYRQQHPALDISDASAIIVDDGAATGSSALAAIEVARAAGAAHIVIAVGAAPPDVLHLLSRHADYAIAAMTPEPFISVGQWYQDFTQVSDDRVLAALMR